ncbi:HN1 [Cervus elaphus hippelaphus]|uniref:HN1 n=1 Tax=Cervus elaphus hippelaphus TaxID=46360 RepID=A0A212DA95_CEREH|nr:HN1 [Cervus elaphus hippelaphus]
MCGQPWGPGQAAQREPFCGAKKTAVEEQCLLGAGVLGDKKQASAVRPRRVLRPPGGGSNFSLGFDEPTEQPVRRNKMASSIFGTPEENPPSWAKSAGAKSSGGREDSESSGPQRRNSSEANSGDFLDLKGEGDIHENVDTDLQASLGQSEAKPVPAAPVPSPVAPAPVPSRRNPPGGKSSLVSTAPRPHAYVWKACGMSPSGALGAHGDKSRLKGEGDIHGERKAKWKLASTAGSENKAGNLLKLSEQTDVTQVEQEV